MPIGSQTNNSPATGTAITLLNGSIWHNGSGVPANTLGIYPDYYIDNDTNKYYFKDCNGTWILRGQFGSNLVCVTKVVSLAINTPLVVSDALIAVEICGIIILDSFNKNITDGVDFEIVNNNTIKLESNVALNNIQIKIQGF